MEILKVSNLKKTYTICLGGNQVHALKDGKILRQWMATGYHIALIFDKNDICEGVSHESST